MNEEQKARSISHWDAYWRVRDKAVALELAGVRDPAFAAFWGQFFARALAGNQPRRLIDIACGHGAVTTVAMDVASASGTPLHAYCVDCSSAALRELRNRCPHVAPVACDAIALPYPGRSFDLVVSQFGIEYAGEAAFAEAARLVADGGVLTAILHSAESALHRECAENLAATRAVSEAKLMTSARAAFGAGFDLMARKMSTAAFQQHDRRLAVAVEAAKRILHERRTSALRAFLANLLRDIGHMYNRIRNYTPEKVFAWLDAMEGELVAYEGRMASMTQSALDEAAIARIASSLSSAGFVVDPPGTLALRESGKPAGWILSARRVSMAAT